MSYLVLTEGLADLSLMGFLQSLLQLRSFVVFIIYIMMVLASHTWVRHSKPRQLTKLMLCYNVSCVLASLYITAYFAINVIPQIRPWTLIFSNSTSAAVQTTFDMYFLLKVWELLDTVFMVLRHKNRQVSFLHVFHHGSMLLLTDFAASVSPWVAMSPVLVLNAVVHIFLYIYYGLTSAGYQLPNSWKRRLTELQIAQFGFGLIYSSYGFFYYNFCPYSILYGLALTSLFLNFYHKAYLSGSAGRRKSNKSKKS